MHVNNTKPEFKILPKGFKKIRKGVSTKQWFALNAKPQTKFTLVEKGKIFSQTMITPQHRFIENRIMAIDNKNIQRDVKNVRPLLPIITPCKQ